jgi:hypothetical protein
MTGSLVLLLASCQEHSFFNHFMCPPLQSEFKRSLGLPPANTRLALTPFDLSLYPVIELSNLLSSSTKTLPASSIEPSSPVSSRYRYKRGKTFTSHQGRPALFVCHIAPSQDMKLRNNMNTGRDNHSQRTRTKVVFIRALPLARYVELTLLPFSISGASRIALLMPWAKA